MPALAGLDLLTPGDFAAVVRQYRLLADTPTPLEFLEQLVREHRAKPDVRFSKPLGFLGRSGWAQAPNRGNGSCSPSMRRHSQAIERPMSICCGTITGPALDAAGSLNVKV